MSLVRLNFILCLGFLLTSCSGVQAPSTNVAKTFNDIEPLDHRLAIKPPEAVTKALIPDMEQAMAVQSFAHRGNLNISVHEVNAREFFMGLVADSDYNMLVHPEVSGQISLELKNVSIEQVLAAVKSVYGYDYKKSPIGFTVYPATSQTRNFKIDRLDLIRAGKSSTFVSSGQISKNADNLEMVNQNQSYQEQDNSQTSGSTLHTTSETDFWLELEAALKTIIAVDKDASIQINRQSGIIVARAKPMQLREIENFINDTQQQIERQVILEIKILEVILDDSHQTGVNWESIVREGIDKAPLLTGLAPLTAANTVFSLGATSGDFRVFLELLETQGKTNILSSPRISTLNNQKAIIKVGQDEYFITRVSTTTLASNSGVGVVNPNVTFTPFFSGIALDVTPQIDDDNSITLHIHPSITRVESQNKEFTINGEDGSVPMALNTVRESDSIVKARNGQVIVLGGLLQESTIENKDGIAGVTRIPWVGNLFRINKGERKKSELIILLKPTIVHSDQDWQNSILPSKYRLQQLETKQLWQ